MAVDMLPILEAEAKERQGERADITEIMPECSGESREKAALATGTNSRYVSDAKRIKNEQPESKAFS